MNSNTMNEEQDTRALKNELHEREELIASLEKELIKTKIQLANAKTSKDHLKLELSNSAAFARALQAPRPDEMHGSVPNNDEVIMTTRDSVSGNKRSNQRVMVKVHSRNKISAKIPRTSSCASGIAFLGGIQSFSDVPASSSRIYSRKISRDASCASAVALLGQSRLSSRGSSASFARRQSSAGKINHTNADWDSSDLTGPRGNMFLQD